MFDIWPRAYLLYSELTINYNRKMSDRQFVTF